MGPIEAELRTYRLDVPEYWLEAGCVFSWNGYRCISDAASSLGILKGSAIADYEARMPEILSEAIEAAEALGL